MIDRKGQQLGDYKLVRLPGRGGLAEVYLGVQVHLNTLAAIKVLYAQLSSEDIEKFHNEAHIISSLKHPHIVEVFDSGVQDGLPFLAMRYAPNGTLRQRHREGSQPPLATIMTYLKQIASALQYAHEHNVIHRDVKPQNMLIGLHDEILLSDFGLAIVSQSTSFQHMQNRAGTLPYMAPEQFEGRTRPATDQYALAVVVNEWLCGEPPFQGTYNEIAMQHQLAVPPSLHEKMPALPTKLEQIVLKALAKDPRERFACVQDFVTALDQACHSFTPAEMVSPHYRTQPSIPPLLQPALSRLPSPGSSLVPRSKATPYRQRHALTWTRILLSLMALIAIGSLGLFSPALLTHHTEVPVTAIPQLSIVATEAAQAYATGTSQGVMSGFDAQHTNFNPYERVLDATNVSHLVPAWTVSTGNIVSDSPIIIYNTVFVIGNKLYALDASTGQPLWATSIDLSPSPAVANGIIYIGSYDGKLYAFDASTGKPRWTAVVGNGNATYSLLTVVNDIVYVGSEYGKIYAFNASTGKQLWVASVSYGNASWATVANGVAYVAHGGKIYAFVVSTGKPLWIVTMSNDPISTIFSPIVANGVIYVGSYDGNLYAFHLAGAPT